MTQTTGTEAPKGLRKLTQFGRDFWVINLIELLERGAYYSLAPLFAIFMLDVFRASGMGNAEAGALAGTLGAVNVFLLYAVPLFAAALAEKYGYKAALVVSFALLVGGYALTLVVGDVAGILAAAILIGFGAGIFKPIAAALVSQTSTDAQRNAAFAIYYGCINLGAFIFPTGLALAVTFYFPDLLIPVAFSIAALLSLVNLVLVLTVFRNINPPRRDVSVLGAFASLGEIVRYPALIVLLVIYSGFWFMYALTLNFGGAYMEEFGRMPDGFQPNLIVSINAGVIILGAPLIAILTDRFRSLSLMTVGIAGYALSLVVLGWSGTPLLFLAGVLGFSFFELVTHPSYLAYVSKIAPPDKVSVFLGYGFIPIAVGLTVGTAVGGALYGSVALEQAQPEMFWTIISSVGLVTVSALLVYNWVLARLRVRSGEEPAPARRGVAFLAGPGAAVVAVLLVPALVLGANVTAADEAGPVDALADDALLELVRLDAIEDATDEGERTSVPLSIAADAAGDALLTLTWTDEAARAGSTNAPDTFVLHVLLANGTRISSEQSDTGELELRFPAAVGEHTIEVELVEAGDQRVQVGGVAVPMSDAQDTGNAWTLARGYERTAA